MKRDPATTPEEEQHEVVLLLREILKWTKVINLPQTKKLLLELLPTPKQKMAYRLSDGRGSKQVSAAVGVSYSTVTVWWKSWIRSGIAESVRAKGGERARKVFDLEDFGISIASPGARDTSATSSKRAPNNSPGGGK
jgi:hypothetical protein